MFEGWHLIDCLDEGGVGLASHENVDSQRIVTKVNLVGFQRFSLQSYQRREFGIGQTMISYFVDLRIEVGDHLLGTHRIHLELEVSDHV